MSEESQPLLSEKVVSRAKFQCNAEVTRKYSQTDTGDSRVYEFSALYDTSTPENLRFTKATPYGKLEIQVSNPAVVFKPGKAYFLDFTEAEE